MPLITVFKFDEPDSAGQMLDLVKELSKNKLIVLDDAAVVTWPECKKKPESQLLHSGIHSFAYT